MEYPELEGTHSLSIVQTLLKLWQLGVVPTAPRGEEAGAMAEHPTPTRSCSSSSTATVLGCLLRLAQQSARCHTCKVTPEPPKGHQTRDVSVMQ